MAETQRWHSGCLPFAPVPVTLRYAEPHAPTPFKERTVRPILTALALILAGSALMASPAMAQNRFWLVNNSGLTIERAYVSPSRLSDWGNDILGRATVAAGDQVRVTPSARDCELDIKVQYEGGQEEEKMKVNACRTDRIVFTNPNGRAERGGGAGGTVETAQGGAGGSISRGGDEPMPRSGGGSGGSVQGGGSSQGSGRVAFQFVNRSGETIQELYVSSSQDDRWGTDRLGRDVLAAGARRRIAVTGEGCDVDIRVVFGEGRAQERRNIAACGRSEIAWP